MDHYYGTIVPSLLLDPEYDLLKKRAKSISSQLSLFLGKEPSDRWPHYHGTWPSFEEDLKALSSFFPTYLFEVETNEPELRRLTFQDGRCAEQFPSIEWPEPPRKEDFK